MAQPADDKTPPRRRPHWRTPLAALAVLLLLAGAAWAWHRHDAAAAHREAFTGYVVSRDIYLASPVGGTLATVAVRRGDRVQAGQALFAVDPTVRAAQADQAAAQVQAGQAQVAQQLAALARAQADARAAQADADRATAELQRLQAAQREKPGAVAGLQLDQASASARAAHDRREAARAAAQTAQAAVQAARAQVQQAQAGGRSAQRELSDLAPRAPGPARVEDVMFHPGESVPANVPVVSLVPDGEVKVRFYVPEPLVARYRPGTRVAIGCDGCAAGLTAQVDFIATRPEYTPPVIYSLDARQKLVFLVEAVPSKPDVLVPGQPLSVGATAADLPTR